MSIAKVKRFAQVTIPADIRRKAHIEIGDYVDISYDTGRIILTPKRRFRQTVEWRRKFDEAIGSVRKSVKRAGITAKHLDKAVKSERKRSGRLQRASSIRS